MADKWRSTATCPNLQKQNNRSVTESPAWRWKINRPQKIIFKLAGIHRGICMLTIYVGSNTSSPALTYAAHPTPRRAVYRLLTPPGHLARRTRWLHVCLALSSWAPANTCHESQDNLSGRGNVTPVCFGGLVASGYEVGCRNVLISQKRFGLPLWTVYCGGVWILWCHRHLDGENEVMNSLILDSPSLEPPWKWPGPEQCWNIHSICVSPLSFLGAGSVVMHNCVFDLWPQPFAFQMSWIKYAGETKCINELRMN